MMRREGELKLSGLGVWRESERDSEREGGAADPRCAERTPRCAALHRQVGWVGACEEVRGVGGRPAARG